MEQKKKNKRVKSPMTKAIREKDHMSGRTYSVIVPASTFLAARDVLAKSINLMGCTHSEIADVILSLKAAYSSMNGPKRLAASAELEKDTVVNGKKVKMMRLKLSKTTFDRLTKVRAQLFEQGAIISNAQVAGHVLSSLHTNDVALKQLCEQSDKFTQPGSAFSVNLDII